MTSQTESGLLNKLPINLMESSSVKIWLPKFVKPFVCLVVLFFSVTADAQRPPTGMWLSGFMPVKISSKLQWHNEGGYRTLGSSSAALQYLYRTGIKYVVNENINTTAGFAFFFTRTSFSKSNNEFGSEFRFWEEFAPQVKVSNKLLWQNRFRIEQRFFEATSRKAAYTAFRFRMKSGFAQQLYGRWSVQLADEYMQQIVKGKLSFDQNRLIVNGIYKYNHTVQVMGGYMWLAWPASSNQHILLVTVQKQIAFHGRQNRI